MEWKVQVEGWEECDWASVDDSEVCSGDTAEISGVELQRGSDDGFCGRRTKGRVWTFLQGTIQGWTFPHKVWEDEEIVSVKWGRLYKLFIHRFISPCLWINYENFVGSYMFNKFKIAFSSMVLIYADRKCPPQMWLPLEGRLLLY